MNATTEISQQINGLAAVASPVQDGLNQNRTETYLESDTSLTQTGSGFDLENTRRALIATRVKYGANTPIGHRCSNIVELLQTKARERDKSTHDPIQIAESPRCVSMWSCPKKMEVAMKLDDIKIGDCVKTDGGFTCMQAGCHVVGGDEHGLFVPCDEGKHYLDGQEDEPGADLVGLEGPLCPHCVGKTNPLRDGSGYCERCEGTGRPVRLAAV